MVKCNFFVYDSKSVEKNHTFNPKFQDLNLAPDGAFNPREEFKQIFLFHASVWANLYESKFMKSIRFFESTKVYQDLPFAMDVLAKTKTMAIIKEPLYHYRMKINQGNSTQFITPERLMQQMTDEALKVLLRYGILEQVKEYFFAHAMSVNYSFYYKTSPKIWKEFCAKMREILAHYDEPQWTYFEPKIKKWAQNIMQGKVPKQSFKQYHRKLFRLRVRDGEIYLKLGDFEWKRTFRQNQIKGTTMNCKDIFKQRYVKNQIFEQTRANDLLNMGFLSQKYKAEIYAKIKRNPIRALYLAPLLLIRAIYKNLSANCHAYQVKHTIKTKPYKALWLMPLYIIAKILQVKNWAKYRIYLRFLRGKVDMPYFELVLTTRCTLRCESCGNLMQYFSSKNQYTCTLQGILDLLDKLFSVIDSVTHIKIIGGEPLLFKDIVKVVERLDSEPKVKSFGMVTNGTIKLKENLLIALSESKKFWLDISDYSTSPNLKIPLYQKEIFNSLQSYKIPYIVRWNDNPLS